MKIVGGNDEKCIIVLLGTAQDAGVPQLGCSCMNCTRAITNDKFKRSVSSLGVINETSGKCFIIDATPDIKEQYIALHNIGKRYLSKHSRQPPNSMKFNLRLNGIFLTHIHMGHYTGLLQLGKESAATNQLPLYITPSVKKFLSTNRPFSDLIRNQNIILKQMATGKPGLVERNFTITPLPVQHRSEFSDTVGYILQGPNNRVLYIPDMDTITQPVLDILPSVNIAIFDGTFYDRNELAPRRKFESVPHPPISETMELLKPYLKRTRIFFTHFNHTNPVLDPDSDANRNVKSMGYGITPEGWTIRI